MHHLFNMERDMSDRYVVIDLGGTRIRAARCRADGYIEARVEQLTHAIEDPRDVVLARIADTARQVWPDAAPVMVGVGSPGPLDPWTGLILNAANIPALIGCNLRDALHEALNAPVVVGNDANVAAMAEHRFGAARGYGDMVYLTISTGIGGGVIIDNKLLLGQGGLAGELGHVTIDYHGERDTCGNIGCLEMIASGPGIRRAAIKRLAAGERSRVREKIDGDLDQVSAELLGEAADAGDAFALSVIGDAARAIGLACVNYLHIFNTSIIVLGGGVTNLGDHLFSPLRETVEAHLMDARYRAPIVAAQLGDNVGLLGALALALDPPKQKAA
jgi:glucokinase